jgi:hypothetical protein
MKYKVLKNFEWAHQHVRVVPYAKNQVIETDDQDLIRVGTEQKWIAEAKSSDVAVQVKALEDEINALGQRLEAAEEAEIAALEQEIRDKQAALEALKS